MKELKYIKTIYFLGIGGIGMSALARYFNFNGIKVVGYDKTPSQLTQELENENIKIHYEDDYKQIPQNIDFVIYTPAIPSDLNEFRYVVENNIPIYKRAEILAWLTTNKISIAVAGTHGKTSTTSLISYLLNNANIDCNAFIGGVSVNYNSNLVLSKNSDIYVVEADEFDKSFLKLFPKYAVITSVDADHLDIYKNKDNLIDTFKQFASQVSDTLIVNKKIENHFSIPVLTYSLNDKKANFYAQNIRIIDSYYYFDLIADESKIADIKFGIAGHHNIENAVAAAAIALRMGVSEDKLKSGLANYKGVRRRFEFVLRSSKYIIIDDYAHHPTEINACLNSVKLLFPNKKITTIFQPHLYSRTRDFGDEFAKSLELSDNILLLDIYPARELPIENINSNWLLNKIQNKNKKLILKQNICKEIEITEPNIILIIGAGDIDRTVSEVKKYFENK